MRIVIFTGGTGSIALQRGLHHLIERQLDGVDTKIIVNAYDNGFSTGTVRHVMSGQILGPSDVRKNQVTRLQLSNPDAPWIGFLSCRFTVEAFEAPRYCSDQLERLIRTLESRGYDVDRCSILFDGMDQYFSSPVAAKVAYEDFSLANILYAGLASANGNSLRAAARIMADVMNIPDMVLLNDDKSLFLGATTRSGKRVTDEGEIVAWGDESDPFTDIFFSNADGKEDRPVLCLEAWQAIVESDLVILSSGTQWSSLIPTYASEGFKSAIRDSKAKVLMVMNRTPDKDSPGQTASDIINALVPRYFDADKLHVLADKNGHPKMRSLDESSFSKVASFNQADLSNYSDAVDKHNAHKLVSAIGCVFFKEYLGSDCYMFDYDDTLVGRGTAQPKSSRFNIEAISHLNLLTKVGVCTGNTIRSVNLRVQPVDNGEGGKDSYKPLLVFADGGVNKYLYEMAPGVDDVSRCLSPPECIFPDALLPTTGLCSVDEIIDSLQRVGVPASKIDNRSNALIAIKPIDKAHCHAFMGLVRHIVCGTDLEVRESGRSTIEIHRRTLSKTCALRHLRNESPMALRITYIGDECESGNDRDVGECASEDQTVKCLHVGSVATTAFFISTLIEFLKSNVLR